MAATKFARRLRSAARSIMMIACFAGHAALVFAQEGQSGSRPSPPIHHSSDATLTEQQTRGAGLFFQRCSLCHLAKTFGAGGSKYCCVASLGPDLSGAFKNLAPDQEKAYRDIILNGGPTYMPPWKYGLSSDEIDDIIAYLKTLG
jgi:mono/diheme cytochrome c family protein